MRNTNGLALRRIVFRGCSRPHGVKPFPVVPTTDGLSEIITAPASTTLELAQTNIYAMIPFSWIRCIFFITSMVLYATDVVRSRTGIQSMESFYPQHAALDTVISYGEYAYTLQTIWKHDDRQEQVAYTASALDYDGNEYAVDQVELWPYKLDTLSVGPRGLAKQLQVEAYPDCLLQFQPECATPFLSLATTFTMLDALFDAIQSKFFGAGNALHFVSFAVEHQWMDTIDQTVLGLFNADLRYTRYLTIHHFRRNATKETTDPIELLRICPPHSQSGARPFFCDRFAWRADAPVANVTFHQQDSTLVTIQEHMALRFAKFQSQNPQLDLEMLVWSAHNPQFVHSLFSVHLYTSCEEVTTHIRGRRCDANHRNCETVFVDDYRYERSTQETNVDAFYGFVSAVRRVAQTYVWLRLVMLVVGMLASTWQEVNHDPEQRQHGFFIVSCMTLVNLCKIPGHVVVYGTIPPVVLYAFAHFVDCHLYHIIVQDKWSSVLGQSEMYDIRSGVLYVALKMRNVWFAGVFCHVFVFFRTHLRSHARWSHRAGIRGFRGTLIGFLSCSTLVFPLPFPSLRHIDVVSFVWEQPLGRSESLKPVAQADFSPSNTGPQLDLRCLLLGLLALLGLALLVRGLCLVLRVEAPVLMAHSTIVPFSAGILWPTLALTTLWQTQLEFGHQCKPNRGWTCTLSRHKYWIQYFDLQRRKPEVWALVRLMNIVMMTDPCVFVRLKWFGVHLFVYRSKAPQASKLGGSSPVPIIHPGHRQLFLLPKRLGRLCEMNALEDYAEDFELVAVVNSTQVSWSELIMCG